MDSPRTPLDELWHELLWQACASDGPIRDNDVREAIRIYRPKIEAAARLQSTDPSLSPDQEPRA